MKRSRRCSIQTIGVLEVLLSHPQKWCYGYEISKETELKSGTLYPILMRLSDRGFLESKWEAVEKVDNAGRPPRHLYRLSKSGVAFAKDQVEKSTFSSSAAVATKGQA